MPRDVIDSLERAWAMRAIVRAIEVADGSALDDGETGPIDRIMVTIGARLVARGQALIEEHGGPDSTESWLALRRLLAHNGFELEAEAMASE